MKFRSKFEKSVYEHAIQHKRKLAFEPADTLVYYVKPARKCRYIPDFVLPNGVIVETKGRLTQPDRAKMLQVATDNPQLDIRFVFQRASNRITRSRNSLTYWEWAERHGFRWSEGSIPQEWWDE